MKYQALSLLFLSSVALANTGAAINRKTGHINYLQGTASKAALVKLAVEACREQAEKPRDCAPVMNGVLGSCEHVNKTKSHYGAFAAHYDGSKGGWQGYLACAQNTNKAWEYIALLCEQCAMGASFFDETDETSN